MAGGGGDRRWIPHDDIAEENMESHRLGDTELFLIIDADPPPQRRPCIRCAQIESLQKKSVIAIQMPLRESAQYSRSVFCLNHVSAVQSGLRQPAHDNHLEVASVDTKRASEGQRCPACRRDVSIGQTCVIMHDGTRIPPVIHQDCAAECADALDEVWKYTDGLLGSEL